MVHCVAMLLLGAATAAEGALERLSEALVDHVADRLGVSNADVEVLHLGVAQPPPCAATATFLLQSAPGERFIGTADVQVLAYNGADRCMRVRAQPRLVVWREVPVAAAPADPGEAVPWTMGRVELARLVGDPMEPGRLEGATWLARTTLSAGDPLTDLVLRPAPDAPRGQDVLLVAGAAGLLVSAPGRLVGDGFLGAPVTIANLASGAVVDGTLLAPGCAAVGRVTPRLQEACVHVQEP